VNLAFRFGVLPFRAALSSILEELKRMSANAKLVVRTGEATPFSNAILRCGVASHPGLSAPGFRPPAVGLWE